MGFEGRSYSDKKLPYDNDRCAYCGDPFSKWKPRTVEHVMPKSQGGIRSKKNKIIVCIQCNQLKGDMTINQFLQALKMSSAQAKESYERTAYRINKTIRNVENIRKYESGKS